VPALQHRHAMQGRPGGMARGPCTVGRRILEPGGPDISNAKKSKIFIYAQNGSDRWDFHIFVQIGDLQIDM